MQNRSEYPRKSLIGCQEMQKKGRDPHLEIYRYRDIKHTG